MMDKAPAWIQNKKKEKGETAAAAVLPTATVPTIPLLMTSSLPSTDHRCDLSCTGIIEDKPYSKLACLMTPHTFTTILDSGMTSHLIKDRGYFLDFTQEDRPPVKTANHGNLLTTGCRTCVVEITLGGLTYRVTLKDCLHALGGVLNLLSVGWVLQKGWDCDFKGSNANSGPHCCLSYHGEALGEIPMTRNLCYLNICFLHPDELSSGPKLHREITVLVNGETAAFTIITISWDVWHAQMGHPGGESVKHLPLVATGVIVETNKPLG